MFLPGKILIQKSEGRLGFLPIMSWSIAVLLGMLLVGPSARAADSEDDAYSRWHFTADEVEAAYQYQQNYGERLRAPLRAGECVFRDVEFSANYRGTKIAVPCRFVNQVTRHLKELLDGGAAKFLFPLDADHAHLGVPKEAWNQKYKDLPVEQLFAALVRDPGLVALYHTAEHLRVTDRKTGALNSDAKNGKTSATSSATSMADRLRYCRLNRTVRVRRCPKNIIPTAALRFSPALEASYFSRWVRAW